jgi:hypothetical protein
MSLTPSFHVRVDLSGSKAAWAPFKDGSEYKDVYSYPVVSSQSPSYSRGTKIKRLLNYSMLNLHALLSMQLAEGVPEHREKAAELEATIKSLPAQHSPELRTMRIPNEQPLATTGTWNVPSWPAPQR